MAVIVYGADWCGDVVSLRRELDARRINYRFIDVDEDHAASERVKNWNNGRRRIPTVEIESKMGNAILRVPHAGEVESELEKLGLANYDQSS